MPLRVLALCLGNICRSPVAEALIRRELAAAGLDAVVDSAGTGAWHVGNPADPRSQKVAHQHGLELTGTARQLAPADYGEQDIILAMDRSNLERARRLAPPTARAKILLMRDFDPEAPGECVPDPYYGGPDGFGDMYRMLERSAREFARRVAAGH
ncbi:low molecular weight protein-tyrosine-phosphatase [Deinococcus sp.]|uniref:low molecular weight protein-tyrosine-phosphatase n=1 Tax=Deinococcus sp. TaxID=47478 RepID=UPI0025BE9E6C|nr:low molecular weight protein-tyrosine-phosphatase [Deinococcus sp.]